MTASLETFGDKVRALAMAIAVHVLCVLLVVVGLTFTDEAKPISVAGPILEATLVSLTPPPKTPVPRPRPQPVKPPPPKPEPQPVEPEIAPPVPPRAEDTRDQEEVDLLAIDPSEAEREQEELRKREQELLEEEELLAERERERERQQQLEDIRRLREEATEQRELEEERLAQLEERELEEQEEAERLREELAAETEPEGEGQPTPGNEGVNDELLGRYALAIQNAVTQNWLRPDNVQQVVCTVRIAQIPGGEVISASVVNPCNADDLTRRSLEAAVMRAQPLPYQGYESVFQRNINFNFCYPRELCRG